MLGKGHGTVIEFLLVPVKLFETYILMGHQDNAKHDDILSLKPAHQNWTNNLWRKSLKSLVSN